MNLAVRKQFVINILNRLLFSPPKLMLCYDDGTSGAKRFGLNSSLTNENPLNSS